MTEKHTTSKQVEEILGCSRQDAIDTIKKLGGEQVGKLRQWTVLTSVFEVYTTTHVRCNETVGGELDMKLEQTYNAVAEFAMQHGGLRNLTIQKRPNVESFYARVYGNDDKNCVISLRVTKEREADVMIAEIKRRFDEISKAGLKQKSTRDFFGDWVKKQEQRLTETGKRRMAASSLKRFTTTVERFLALPGLPNEVSQISKDHIEDYLDFMRTTKQSRNARIGYNEATTHHDFVTLKRIFDWGVSRRFVKTNPCAEIDRLERPSKPTTQVGPYDDDLLVAIFAEFDRRISAEETRQKDREAWTLYREMFYFMFYTSMRVSDVSKLTWGEVSLPFKTIVFVQQKTGHKKSMKTIVRIPALLAKRMLAYVPKKPDPEQLVFQNTNGGMVKQSHLDVAIRTVLKKLGKTKKSPIHSFRHTSIMRMIQSGMTIDEVAAQAGDTVETIYTYYVTPTTASEEHLDKAFGHALVEQSDDCKKVQLTH